MHRPLNLFCHYWFYFSIKGIPNPYMKGKMTYVDSYANSDVNLPLCTSKQNGLLKC
jgi:hypothetical protein